ncbi:type IV secretion system DNA-binding domain-containing protein [Candidatus Nomurabacteria bacterium]|nr:type IV secretion system DNA-binding domain-containing protein [Candidatus Nomurabacteria bacterium]
MVKDRTYFAETDFRGKRTKFGIKFEDRARHVYVIGKTGMGKSTMLENMAVQDIADGHGMAFIDPHGSTAEKLLEYVPEHRIKDVIYFAPFDLENPISFNVMEDVGADQRHLVVNGLMSAFKKLWVDAWSARMEYILTNTLLALLEYPNSTLLGVNRMLADKVYRQKVVDNIKDPTVRSFWVDEFAKYTERFAAEATPAIQNKIGQFTGNPLIRNIIGQTKSSFSFRQAMDERKILIINLSKGRMGEGNANLLGSMIITKIYLAAMSRANLSPAEMRLVPPFYFYVDEFQSFANESFANILSEARKYKLSLTIAHQYVEQMSEEVQAAVFGNVGTTVAFRVGPLDAEIFEKIFAPTFSMEDMVNLGFAQIYLTMMIDGVGSQPFSAITLPPITPLARSYHDEIISWTRKTYARPRDMVEKDIGNWHATPSTPKTFVPPLPPRTAQVSRPNPPVSRVDAVTPKKFIEPEKVVSLKSLEQKVETREKSTGRHSADLRDVIASVQKEVAGGQAKTLEEKAPEKTAEKRPRNEIPENELKKMLEV